MGTSINISYETVKLGFADFEKEEVSNWENHIALRLQMSYLFNEERVVTGFTTGRGINKIKN